MEKEKPVDELYYSKDYIQVREYIDIIITTAKLIGYQIICANGYIHINLNPQKKEELITILLGCDKGIPQLSTVVLDEGTFFLHENKTQEEKIEHLNYIMNKL